MLEQLLGTTATVADSRPPTQALAGEHRLRHNDGRDLLMKLALDFTGLVLLLVGSMTVRHGWTWPDYPMWRYALSLALIVLLFLVSFYFGGLYERESQLGRSPVLPIAIRHALIAGGSIALGNLVITGLLQTVGLTTGRALPIPTANLMILILGSPLVLAAVRRFMSWLQAKRDGPPRLVLVGDDPEVEVARRHVVPEWVDITVVGATSEPCEVTSIVDGTGATDVLMLSGEWSEALYPNLLDHLNQRQVPVLQRVSAAETLYGLARIRQVGGIPTVLLRPHLIPRSRAHLKRVTDIALLTVGLPAWLPLLVALSIFTRVAVGRPILYWQDRVGANGRVFRLVKFRTMRVDAERDGTAQLAAHDDPRVAKATSWMRAMRLDELPQVFNVFRGEMSLIGPRPERPEFTADFERNIPGYSRRYEAMPGITGLAQVHGNYGTDAAYKLGYDLQYVANWSLLLDLEILLRTVWVIIARRI